MSGHKYKIFMAAFCSITTQTPITPYSIHIYPINVMVLYQWLSPFILYAFLSKPEIANPIKDINNPVSIKMKLNFKQIFFIFIIFIFSPSSF